MQEPAPRQSRVEWLDLARGFGIVLVVYGHASRTVVKTLGLEWSDALRQLDHAIYSFHMPLFFLLAGMTTALAHRRRPSVEMSGLLWSIIVPYLVWSALTIALRWGTTAGAGAALGPRDLVAILWQPHSVYWFLYDLLLIKLAWQLIVHIESRALAVVAISAPLAVVASNAEFGTEPFDAALFYFAAIFLVGAALTAPARRIGLRGGLLLTIVGSIVWAAMTPWLEVARPTVAAGAVALAGCAALIGLAVLTTGLPGAMRKPLAAIGASSLAIYAAHALFIAEVRVLLAKAGMLEVVPLLVLGTVIGVLGPLTLLTAASWVSRSLRIDVNRLVGLGPCRAPKLDSHANSLPAIQPINN